MQIPFPNKKYQIIYADPPWDYEDKKSGSPAFGGATYLTMKLEEIKNMPIEKITEEDCTLFLWVTMPMLQEGLEVIKSWGFKYRTCAFTWIKQNPSGNGIYSGLGSWTNGNAELCLFAKKGHPKRIAKNVKQIQIYPVGRHSTKPPIIRNEIIRLVGDLPRIELFARPPKDRLFEDESYKGWDVWGNEI